MIPPEHIVHVLREAVALNARVEDDGLVELSREACRGPETGGAAADDKDVVRGGHCREEEGVASV